MKSFSSFTGLSNNVFNISNLRILKSVGSGQFGEVFLTCREDEIGELFALKIIGKKHGNEGKQI